MMEEPPAVDMICIICIIQVQEEKCKVWFMKAGDKWANFWGLLLVPKQLRFSNEDSVDLFICVREEDYWSFATICRPLCFLKFLYVLVYCGNVRQA